MRKLAKTLFESGYLPEDIEWIKAKYDLSESEADEVECYMETLLSDACMWQSAYGF